ncbi:MAG: hypothetical protein WCD43_07650 [Candidatus Acidiferrales bacterium]
MRARLTGTTVLAGLMAGCSSEQVHGSAAGSLAVLDLDADLTVDSATVASLDAVSRDVEQLVVDSAEVRHAVVVEFTAEVASTVVGAVSTVAVVRTVEAVTAADTGKIQR